MSLYIEILSVVDNLMYDSPLILKYILANVSSVLKSSIDSFAVSCIIDKQLRSSSFLISYFPTSKHIGLQLALNGAIT